MNRYFAHSPRFGRVLAVFALALVGVLAAQNHLMAMWVPMKDRSGSKQAEVRQEHWDLNKQHVALSGYDPVSYFSGEKPSRGSKSITAKHEGVTYRFANQANRAKFLETPAKYEPAYGGWCAYALVKGGKTSPDPKRFKIVDGRLLLFYDAWGTDTLDLWNQWLAEGKSEAELLETADREWATIVAAE